IGALGPVDHRFLGNPVQYTRGAARAGHDAGFIYVERPGVVGLVTGSVTDRDARVDPQFCGSGGIDFPLGGEGGVVFGDQRWRDSVFFKKDTIGVVGFKIPHDSFAQSGDGTANETGHFVGDVVAWQHDFIDLIKQIWLVLLYPPKFGKGKIPRVVVVGLEKFVRVQEVEELISGVDGAAVAPDDGRPEHFALAIDDHQTVHLV